MVLTYLKNINGATQGDKYLVLRKKKKEKEKYFVKFFVFIYIL